MNVRVSIRGLVDGWQQPDDFTSGMTYEDPSVSLVYDRAVNIGQAARIFARAIRTLGMKGPNL